MKTLLKNGKIYNGKGDQAFKGDILVQDGIIVQIAPHIETDADKKIDCEGLCISPGFIDAHSHNDFFIGMTEQYFAPFLKQGITTQVTGNCGFSAFGVDKTSLHKDMIGGGLFCPDSPGTFLDFIDKGKGKLFVNIAPLVGLGSLRAGVNGLGNTELGKEQMQQIINLTEEALGNGAVGGSIGLMYEPGMYSPKEEIYEFAKTISKFDGILTVHPRACSKVALGYRPIFSRPHIEIALDEVVDIAKVTGVRLQYSHLIFVGQTSWKSCDTMLAKLRKLNAGGIDIGYDNYSFPFGASVITVILPPGWKKTSRWKLKLIINVTKKMLGIDFDDITVAYISDDHRQYEGKTVAQCAKEENIPPFNMYMKLVELSKGKGRIFCGKYYNEEIILKLMQDDLGVFMTDAWIEPTGIQNGAAFQGFPYFLTRAREHGFGLEKIIHKMTGATAKRFGLTKRGVLEPGNHADITVFDYENLEVNAETPDFTPKGIKHVFINGRQVIDNEKYTPLPVGQWVLKK